MSENLPPEKNVDEPSQEYQRNKAPTKIPGTAVFRSPYSVSSKTGSSTPYYIMTSTAAAGTSVNPNASDEDKRRIIHNNAERKRKEKINKWIVRLCSLVPECNGKLSKNCILEKTVNFIEQLKQEKQLPDDVQALKTEVIKLTKNLESLSSENAHYLALLKEAQQLSKGAWSLNMSIHRNKTEKTSSGSDGEDTTMTPTLDRIIAGTSNLTKAASAPNLPSIVQTPPKPQKLIVPLMTGVTGVTGVTGPQLISATGQPIQVKLQTQAGIATNNIGPIMSANIANPTQSPLNLRTTLVTPIVGNGQPVLTNAPIFANVQVKDANMVKTNGSAAHSIQALLGASSEHATTNGISGIGKPGGLYMASPNTPIMAAAASNTPIVAQPQTPLLVQGQNGPVVIMVPGSLPQFAVPLNTLSSNQVMCESTFAYKSPILFNQFPSLLNYHATTSDNTVPQIGSVIQGPQGQQQVVVGAQPVIAQLPTQNQTGHVPVVQSAGSTCPTMAVGVQGGQTAATMPVVGVQQSGVVGVQQGSVVGLQQGSCNMVGVQQGGMVGVQQVGMVGMQQGGMVGMQQGGMVGMQQGGMVGMQQGGMVGMQQGGMVGVQATAPMLQVVSGVPSVSEGTVFIPPSNVTSQPCFIPVVDQGTGLPVTGLPVTVTPVSNVAHTSNLTLTTAPPTSRTSTVTDFSISQICQPFNVLPEESEDSEDSKHTMMEASSGDIYLTSTSDTSFSSDCFTPPHANNNNVMLSAVNYGDALSPDPDAKPLNHSIASLTGINN